MQRSSAMALVVALLATMLMAVLVGHGAAQPAEVPRSPDGVWQIRPGARFTPTSSDAITPDTYVLAAVDGPALKATLDAAPLQSMARPESPITLWLPLPDATFARFSVVNAPIMEPGLAVKFPEISTYIATGLDNPALWGRLDVTPDGFHGMIFAPDDVYFIDPADSAASGMYLSYTRSGYMTEARRATREMVQHAPLVAEDEVQVPQAPAAPVAQGETMRRYRLAVAATGEYTQFHGGTVPQAMAAIVTTINRVVGIYEHDLAVTLVLIANNDQIIYTNGDTDPYTNDNGPIMLSENQANLTAVIGSANYDVGHVFSTGGGGVATLRSPCSLTSKARGVTGSSNPINDPFDVDYVAHELGHQFGANHTFNGTSLFCAGNRSGGAAYEPGSASTIMGYAGICGAEDLQSNSDPYFHIHSIAEVQAFITNPSTGDSCDTPLATQNTPPVAEAGANGAVPARTPLILRGAGADDDGDSLTYVWEQYDLGAASPPNTDDGSRPIFRSFNPTASPDRILPRLQNILSGATTLGESLPTTNRTLTFRLTVRDGASGVAFDTKTLQVVDTGSPFAVTAPSGPATLNGQSPLTVTWDVAGTTAAPISCATVNIRFAVNGINYNTLLANGVPNTGSASVTVPNFSTTTGRIWVECATQPFFNINSGALTLVPAGDFDFAVYVPLVLR